MKKALFLVGVLLPTSGSGLALRGKSLLTVEEAPLLSKMLLMKQSFIRRRRDFLVQTQDLPRLILDLPNRVDLSLTDIWGTDTPTLLSGACDGADTRLATAALGKNQKVVHLMTNSSIPPNESTIAGQDAFICTIPGEDTARAIDDDPRVAAALEETAVQRNEDISEWKPKSRRATHRNWFQTRRAQSVYVVGYRAPLVPSFKILDGEKGFPDLDIGGGTGWAAQFYANRFTEEENPTTEVGGEDDSRFKLYFFDDSNPDWKGNQVYPETHNRWNEWIPQKGRMTPLEGKWQPLPGLPPAPSGVYAAIGGTIISGTTKWKGHSKQIDIPEGRTEPSHPTGMKAINALFEQGLFSGAPDEDDR
jgi:hypothetical protein